MKGQEEGARKHGMKAGRKIQKGGQIQKSGQIAGLAEKFAHAGKNPKQLGRCNVFLNFFIWMGCFPPKNLQKWRDRLALDVCLQL